MRLVVVGSADSASYPLGMSLSTKLCVPTRSRGTDVDSVPRREVLAGVGWIAAFGQAGSAFVPFITGVLAEQYSVKILQPVMIALLGSMGSVGRSQTCADLAACSGCSCRGSRDV